MKEKDFQEWLRQLAGLTGWLYYHPHRSQHSAAGFPDTVLVKGNSLIFAELKVGRNKPTRAQHEWLSALTGVCGEVYVWYPEDRAWIERRLRQ